MQRIFTGLFLLFFAVLTNCAHHVPLREGFELANPPDPKYDKRVLLVMPQEQAELVIRHTPDSPFADTYVFPGGPALKGTLLSVLGQIYADTAFAFSFPEDSSNYDLAIEVNFHSYDIVLNIYTGNIVTLGIDYRVRGKNGTIMTMPTKTASTDAYSGGDKARALIFGAFSNIGKMKESSGAAWDQATANSVGMLLEKLLKLEG